MFVPNRSIPLRGYHYVDPLLLPPPGQRANIDQAKPRRVFWFVNIRMPLCGCAGFRSWKDGSQVRRGIRIAGSRFGGHAGLERTLRIRPNLFVPDASGDGGEKSPVLLAARALPSTSQRAMVIARELLPHFVNLSLMRHYRREPIASNFHGRARDPYCTLTRPRLRPSNKPSSRPVTSVGMQ